MDEEKNPAKWKEMLTDEQKKSMEKQKLELGGLLHDGWREDRKKEDGSYEPRTKVLVKTAEGKEKWFNEDQVPKDSTELRRQDIANTDFKDLDPYWQADNKASADVAIDILTEAKASNLPLDDEFIENASSKIHNAWRERTPWAPKEQLVDYDKLSEKDQNEDRKIIKKALSMA